MYSRFDAGEICKSAFSVYLAAVVLFWTVIHTLIGILGYRFFEFHSQDHQCYSSCLYCHQLGRESLAEFGLSEVLVSDLLIDFGNSASLLHPLILPGARPCGTGTRGCLRLLAARRRSFSNRVPMLSMEGSMTSWRLECILDAACNSFLGNFDLTRLSC